jgi:hypothetical protein
MMEKACQLINEASNSNELLDKLNELNSYLLGKFETSINCVRTIVCLLKSDMTIDYAPKLSLLKAAHFRCLRWICVSSFWLMMTKENNQ